MSSGLPVGILMPFGGEVPNKELAADGWLVCDGYPYAVAQKQALAGMIANNFGGDGVATFNVPDLRGRFLRGTSHGVGIDPERDTRVPSGTGGPAGDATGSAQGFSTGPPHKGFTVSTAPDHVHLVAGIPQKCHNIACGASGPLARHAMDCDGETRLTTTGGAHTHGVLGGDSETRPANLYVNWLIASAVVTAVPPIGTVMAFAGDTTDIDVSAALAEAGWYACSGQSLRKDPRNEPLYKAISGIYGESDLSFDLPDLRGYFVVGADDGVKIGVKQSYSTGAPVKPFVTDTAPDHTHVLGGLPTDAHTIDVVMGLSQAELNDNESPVSPAGSHVHTVGGGDPESRPLNVYVDYVIRFI